MYYAPVEIPLTYFNITTQFYCWSEKDEREKSKIAYYRPKIQEYFAILFYPLSLMFTLSLWSCSGGAFEYTYSHSGIAENRQTNHAYQKTLLN